MKAKVIAAALLASSAGHANELGKLMAVCQQTSKTQAELVNCQQVFASIWFQADAVARALPDGPIYVPPPAPQTNCKAVQNVFGNWDVRCY